VSTRFCSIAVSFLLFFCFFSSAAKSQSVNLNDDSLGLLRQGLQQLQSDPSSVTGSPTFGSQPPSVSSGSGNVIIPAVPADVEQPSPVEADYSSRAGSPLQLVGYDTINGVQVLSGTPMGAVGDDYVMGVGDQLLITIRGQRNESYKAIVDSSGQITVPAIAPVVAAGRHFGDVKSEIEARLQETFLQSQAYISLGAIRQLSVLVGGEVRRPGLKTVTGISSVVDALVVAGGVKKSGSLRRVLLVRDGKQISVDLYSLMLGIGKAPDVKLRDGDRILVPVLGPTIAVIGDVMRPGIYELSGDTIDANSALALAGGGISAQGNVLARLRVGSTGQREIADLETGSRSSLARGDILKVERRGGGDAGSVMLTGNVSLSGRRPLAQYPTLFSLVGTPGVLGARAYLPFVVVVSRDKSTGASIYRGIDVSTALKGGGAAQPDLPLASDDTVIILSLDDVHYLSSVDVQNVLNGLPPVFGLGAQPAQGRFREGISSADTALDGEQINLSSMGELQRQSLLSTASSASAGVAMSSTGSSEGKGAVNRTAPSPKRSDGISSTGAAPAGAANALLYCAGLRNLMGNVARRGAPVYQAVSVSTPPEAGAPDPGAAFNVQACPKIFDDQPELLAFLIDHSAEIQGEVRNPGAYPISADAAVQTLLLSAGGLTDTADSDAIEVTNFSVANKGAAVRQVIRVSDSAALKISAGDVVRVGRRFTQRDIGSVALNGEVERPGLYAIRRGETLSELIRRAGGLTPQAYPIGSVFTRESVRQQEQDSYEIAARELESGMGPALINLAGTSGGAQATGATVAAVQELVKSLRSAKAVGRVVTEADPAILTVRPELDTILQPGDALFVPKRPSHVSVAGEVLHPGAQQFSDGLSASDYIRDSGGFGANSDDSRVYVILPSGKAKPIKSSFWNFSRENIPPGSTIVVPRDLTPFSFWAVAKDLTQLFSQIALSAASLAVISSNN
jgi:protein involved in polysaccharide export with SLBB domain